MEGIAPAAACTRLDLKSSIASWAVCEALRAGAWRAAVGEGLYRVEEYRTAVVFFFFFDCVRSDDIPLRKLRNIKIKLKFGCTIEIEQYQTQEFQEDKKLRVGKESK